MSNSTASAVTSNFSPDAYPYYNWNLYQFNQAAQAQAMAQSSFAWSAAHPYTGPWHNYGRFSLPWLSNPLFSDACRAVDGEEMGKPCWTPLMGIWLNQFLCSLHPNPTTFPPSPSLALLLQGLISHSLNSFQRRTKKDVKRIKGTKPAFSNRNSNKTPTSARSKEKNSEAKQVSPTVK